MDLFIFSKTLINIVYQIKLIFCYFDKKIYHIYKIISKRSVNELNKLGEVTTMFIHLSIAFQT